MGDVQGIGTLWAVELMADRKTRKPLSVDAGSWIRDWCWDNGMILRNNRNMLVIAPALIISKEEVDRVMDFLHRGIRAAMKHFGL
ncbi:MAG: putative aminotransferase [Lentisphaerae bacterium ADurb.Bin242]|nr:MAG: putative aminotransferase [Lentisphaerae bacterium ADurb.Bin242]